MATEERVKNTWYIELTRKEAANIIGLLGAQLADEPLIGNQGGACPDVKVFSKVGQVKVWMAFIVDPNPRDNAGEIIGGGQTIIVLSRREASEIIGLLGAQLAGMIGFGGHFQPGACPNVSVLDRGKLLYCLALSVEGSR